MPDPEVAGVGRAVLVGEFAGGGVASEGLVTGKGAGTDTGTGVAASEGAFAGGARVGRGTGGGAAPSVEVDDALTGGVALLTTAAGAVRAIDCVGGNSAMTTGAGAGAGGAGALAIDAGSMAGAIGAGACHHQNAAAPANSIRAAATSHHTLKDEASSTSL